MASPLLCNQSLNLVSPVGPLSEVSSPAISPSTSPGSAPRRAAAVRPDGSGLSSGTQAYALTGRAAHRRGQQAKQVFTGERFRPGGIGDDVLTLTAAGGLSLLLFRPQPFGESLSGYRLCHPASVGLGQLHRLLDVQPARRDIDCRRPAWLVHLRLPASSQACATSRVQRVS